MFPSHILDLGLIFSWPELKPIDWIFLWILSLFVLQSLHHRLTWKWTTNRWIIIGVNFGNKLSFLNSLHRWSKTHFKQLENDNKINALSVSRDSSIACDSANFITLCLFSIWYLKRWWCGCELNSVSNQNTRNSKCRNNITISFKWTGISDWILIECKHNQIQLFCVQELECVFCYMQIYENTLE